MTVEHFRPLLDNVRDLRLFHSLAEGLACVASWEVDGIAQTLWRSKRDYRCRCGATVGVLDHAPTAWDGCGICNTTLPVRLRDTCRMHCTRFVRFARRRFTIIPIDGIGAFDQISLELRCRRGERGRRRSGDFLFVRSFHGSPHMWRYSSGITHTIPQRGRGATLITPLLSGATRCVASDRFLLKRQ